MNVTLCYRGQDQRYLFDNCAIGTNACPGHLDPLPSVSPIPSWQTLKRRYPAAADT